MKLVQKISFGLTTASVAAAMLITPVFADTIPGSGTVPLSKPSAAAQANLAQAGTQAGISTTVTLPELIGRIINIVLSLLGVIFLALAVYGGYEWMTAQGDDKQVTSAKNIIKNSIIGLVIIVAAYAISNYVVQSVFIAAGQ